MSSTLQDPVGEFIERDRLFHNDRSILGNPYTTSCKGGVKEQRHNSTIGVRGALVGVKVPILGLGSHMYPHK